MNIKDLKIFKEVIHSKSMNQAAIRLNYAQSNVTSRIKALEEELNTILFHRHQKGVTLTAEGEELLPYVQKIISLAEEMEMIASSKSQVAGDLSIATVETVIGLPQILKKYIQRFEQVNLALSSGVTSYLIEQVEHYRLDGAFVTKGPLTEQGAVHSIPVFNEKLVLISNKKNKSIEQLLEKPVIRFSEGCMYRAKLEEWFVEHQRIPKKVLELGTLETMINAVISGLGIAYLPYGAVKQYIEKEMLYAYELEEKYSHIETVFVYRKGDYIFPALEAFIEIINEIREQNS